MFQRLTPILYLLAAGCLLIVFAGGLGTSHTPMGQWPLFDGASLMPANMPQEAHFEAYLWQGAPGQTTWRVVHNGAVTVHVDGKPVFQGEAYGSPPQSEFDVAWDGDWLHLEIAYAWDPAEAADVEGARIEMGLYEPALWGWKLLAPHRLYPAPPDPAVAAREVTLFHVTNTALVGFLLSAAALLALWAWRGRLWQRREAQALAVVVMVALGVRLILLADRAAADPHFYHLVYGSDNYVQMARMAFAGTFSVAGAYWQPGGTVWLAGLMRLVGPHLWGLYVASAVTGALSVALVAGAGWVGFGRRAGLVGGLIAALYPPLVFFHTTLQPAAMASVLTAAAALAGMWALHRRQATSGAAVYGLATGWAALLRSTALVYGPALFLALVMTSRLRRVAWLTGTAAVFTLLAIAPQTLANYSVGSPYLISGNAAVALYAGNNRDADGTAVVNVGQAWDLTRRQGGRWEQALREDIQTRPRRAVELLLHKLGLFWGQGEVGNNVDYASQGLGASPLLRVLALDGRLGWVALSALALAGLLLGRRRAESGAVWLLAGMVGLYAAATALVYVISRLRVPVAPLLCIAAGAAVVQVRRVDRPALVHAGGAVLAAVLLMQALEHQLPRKPFIDALPAGATPTYYDFEGQVRIVGIDPIESNYRRGGYAYVTIYWQRAAPTPEDYAVFVHLVDFDENLVTANDKFMLGVITYPPVGTTDWPLGAILPESYLIELPEDMPPVANLYAGVYYPETLERLTLNLPDGRPTDRDVARISAIGVVPPEGYPTLSGDTTPAGYKVGDALQITRVRIPERVAPGETLEVALEWKATQPVPEDYTVFLHLFHPAQDPERVDPVVQIDVPAVRGDFPTSALAPGYPIGATHRLTLPPNAPEGDYLLRMGVYPYPSFVRLPIWDAQGRPLQDGLIDLAKIRVDEYD